MEIHSVGIDLGKTTFHLVALGAAGKVLLRKKFTQKQFIRFTANMQTSLIGMEACSGSHHKGREFSSWLGLVPRQHSTGGKARLFGISKRGNCYLRKLLIHGARSAVLRVKRERSPFGSWLDSLERRSPVNIVITAAANKLARIAWAVLSSGNDCKPVHA